MHVRYCECDECLPGTPAEATMVTFTNGRKYATPRDRKRAENQRAYMKRKLKGAAG